MNQIFYVSNYLSKEIHVWKINYFGILKLIQIVHTSGYCKSIIIHPKKPYLYIGVRPNYKVIVYYINNRGLLNEIGQSKILGSPTYLNILNDKLYCASYKDSNLSVSLITYTGITEYPMQLLSEVTNCHSINIDIINNTLLIPCLTEDKIRIYDIHKNGLINLKYTFISVKPGSGPRHIAFHSNGKYCYIINELNGTVNILKINNNKKYSILHSIKIFPKEIESNSIWSSDIHITPNNKWLYCTDRHANIIIHFKILDNGKNLKLISYKLTEHQPHGFNIDKNGKFLISAGQKSNFISVYKINQTNGKLLFMSRYKSGIEPIWISFL
ncbi:MAG: beta-propeller fold lactonase family protein [Enterobacterales bacterium]